jgi:tetratricopeptide (TPR) repeat protein
MRISWGLILGAALVPGLLGTSVAAGPRNQPDRTQPSGGNMSGSQVQNSNGSSNPDGGKVDTAAVAALNSAESTYSSVTDPQADSAKLRDALKTGLAQVEKFQQTQDYDHLVDCLFLIGNCYYELGEWANAEKFMTMCNELGNRYFADQMGSAPLKIIAESQYEQQKYDDALKTYQTRVEKIEKQGASADQGELAGALFDVAEMMINLDRAAEAGPLLQQAEQANAAQAAAQAKNSATTQQEKDANVVDHAEIVYNEAIALFRQNKLAECRPKLESALGLFDSINSTGRENVSDRMVAVLDDLTLVCDKLGDKAASDKYKAQRDKLNQ